MQRDDVFGTACPNAFTRIGKKICCRKLVVWILDVFPSFWSVGYGRNDREKSASAQTI